MLNLALQMSLEPDANTPVRPGPEEPKPVTDAEKSATATDALTSESAVNAAEAPAPAAAVEAPAAPAPEEAPAAPAPESAKKPRKKQKYKDLIGGMMKSQGDDSAKKTATQGLGGGEFAKVDKI